MPAINDIVKEKEMQRLNDFEQLVYLFENNKNDILKSKERLVKVFMDKYEEMQKDDELWSTAMAIQMGEARYRNGLRDSFEEGKAAGKMEGKIEGKLEGERQLLHRQMKSSFMRIAQVAAGINWGTNAYSIHIGSGMWYLRVCKKRISKSDTTI